MRQSDINYLSRFAIAADSDSNFIDYEEFDELFFDDDMEESGFPRKIISDIDDDCLFERI